MLDFATLSEIVGWEAVAALLTPINPTSDKTIATASDAFNLDFINSPSDVLVLV